MGSFIVTARSDGRGGSRPFGVEPKKSESFIGKLFNIGGRDIKVTTDGRLNIPKKIMDSFGITGKDGRKRITITYTSTGKMPGKERKYAGFINKPLAKDKNRKNGWKVTQPRLKTKRGLKSADSGDYNWSPV